MHKRKTEEKEGQKFSKKALTGINNLRKVPYVLSSKMENFQQLSLGFLEFRFLLSP